MVAGSWFLVSKFFSFCIDGFRVSRPEHLKDPSFSLMNVFRMVTVMEKGDSCMLKFRFDFLMIFKSNSLV